jgi:membrane fusion protein (multidrug efflux system)
VILHRRATALAIWFGLVASLFGAAPQAVAQGGAPLPAVYVAPVVLTDLRERIRFPGRVFADQRIDVRARVTGFLKSIEFIEGEMVAQGDVLYVIEDDVYRAALAEIEGSIAAAEAQLQLAQIERDRREELVQRGSAPQRDLDIAVANLGIAEGEVQRLRGTLQRATLDLSYTRIVAPFAGAIGQTRVDVGALIGPEAGALTTLTRSDMVRVEFPVTSREYVNFVQTVGRDTENGNVTVALTLPNGTAFDSLGRIDFVDTEVNAQTDTIILRARFENPRTVLVDGMLVQVELVSDSEQMVLNIPQRAVQTDQRGSFVLVVDADNVVEQRRVQISRTTDGRSVLAEGVVEGEQVIVDGINKVRPGIQVDAALSPEG